MCQACDAKRDEISTGIRDAVADAMGVDTEQVKVTDVELPALTATDLEVIDAALELVNLDQLTRHGFTRQTALRMITVRALQAKVRKIRNQGGTFVAIPF